MHSSTSDTIVQDQRPTEMTSTSMKKPAREPETKQDAKQAAEAESAASPASPKRPHSSQARTPMMKQYLKFKEEHPSEILFFRMGDFYEMFYEDADVVARVLGLTKTARHKGSADEHPMAGIPHHAIDRYLPRLIDAGYRVAIAEQVEDPKEAKGIVKRAIVDVITPGTITDERYLNPQSSNYLLMVHRKGKAMGLSWLDISTGQFRLMEIASRAPQLRAEIERIGPKEILIADKVSMAMGATPPTHSEWIKTHAELGHTVDMARRDVMLTMVPDWTVDRDTAVRSLREHFGVKSLEGFGINESSPAVTAAGALLQYASRMKAGQLGVIRRPRMMQSENFVRLDGATIRCLEIVSTLRGNQEATLYQALNHTVTSMGARLLREWLLCPLLNRERIESRQSVVAILKADSLSLAGLRESLQQVHDLERLAQKLSSGRANGRDLWRLKLSLENLPTVLKACQAAIASTTEPDGPFQKLLKGFSLHAELQQLLKDTIRDDPKNHPSEGPVIQDGFNEALDKWRNAASRSESILDEYKQSEVERTGIPSLKVGENRVFGFYIEVTNAHKSKVPDDYVRKQTLKNAERYITTRLKELEDMIVNAKDEALALETKIYDDLRESLTGVVHELQKTANILAHLDVLANFAEVATERGHVRPKLRDDTSIRILGGRHPILDAMPADEPFVPNDFCIGDAENGFVSLITGPNMAGKSTYIRQVALLTLMAQMGCFIPAESAEVGLCDRIFTRIGSADELARGLSTFMVEMVETANILNNATNRSLIVLDEVGRGTSTYDGVSIAWAMTEHIHDKIKARTLFATHYHELTTLSETKPGVKNYNVSVKEWQDEIIFLRKIVAGGADKSYGIHVARLAGVPKQVIARARVILDQLEQGDIDIKSSGPKATPVPKEPTEPQAQLSLFQSAKDPIHEKLADLDLNNMTPMQCMLALNELKTLL